METIIAEVQPSDNVFNPVYTSWFYCKHCWDRQEQVFKRDEGIYEVYECVNCHQDNRKAVR